ncbi:MAG: biotin carboxylase N-terminal domain-containing protein [Pseudomonadota bacterium]
MQTVLVANRGEIACRILHTLRDRGLRSVAVYTDADAAAPHVAMADTAIRIGAGPIADSYLNIKVVIEAAQAAGADAVHPGYGFLSENPAFAEAVDAAGMTFIGPPAAAIRTMGDKALAKQAMQAAGVPCVPGYDGQSQDQAAMVAAAEQVGFPLMVKASAGGGGRGMRLVEAAADLPAALDLARAEAASAFGADHLILERALQGARHVEFQVFADAHGRVVHLAERDCSVQRRHQKVIEEAPCPVMRPDLRARMGEAAIAAARAVEYRGAGTIEFLLADDGTFYFLEMNTRLQVEHPVTELITGLDLVALQLDVAQGLPLPPDLEEVTLSGHAIEARVYAEDPAAGYLPSTGTVALWRPASGAGVRVDGGISEGQIISPFYDPMLAKVVAWGETREIARQRLMRALADTALIGPNSNIPALTAILSHPDFVAGNATTTFLADSGCDRVEHQPASSGATALAAALTLRAAQRAAAERAGYLSTELLGWTSGPAPDIPMTLSGPRDEETALRARCEDGVWHVTRGGQDHAVKILAYDGTQVTAELDGHSLRFWAIHRADGELAVQLSGQVWRFRSQNIRAARDAQADGRIMAPMPGQVMQIDVAAGRTVHKGQVLAVLEAMKMQHQIVAPAAGVVLEVNAAPGEQVTQGDLLIALELEEG